jgi:predicted NAD/FAD-binding protein
LADRRLIVVDAPTRLFHSLPCEDLDLRIAIIGTGISGLTAAHYLQNRHELTLFDAADYVGGHTHTVDVEFEGEKATIDTGFIVFNDWTYPNFIALLNRLGVLWQDTNMSFSVRCDQTGWEYNGGSLPGMFVQKRNLIRPQFWRMIQDILRFNRDAPRILQDEDQGESVGSYLSRMGYSRSFADRYLIPMGASIWSCPPGVFSEFPIRFIVEFYRNHGLLSVSHRPTWRTILGGSREYVRKLIAPLESEIRLRTPIVSVKRDADRVEVRSTAGLEGVFDHVIFACHSDQALKMLQEPTQTERQVLSEFPYHSNDVVLHTDVSVMPRRRGAWAAWNYHVASGDAAEATLTYDMNLLQNLQKKHRYLVTLNSTDQIDPSRVLGRYTYAHPVYTTRRAAAQRRHGELLNQNRTSFCGAYWGNGFHEDGVKSALAVCEALEHEDRECTAVSTKGSFDTVDSHRFAMSSAIGST